MAQRIASAVLSLSTDATAFNAGLADVEKRTTTLKDRFGSVGESLKGFGSKLTSAGSTMTKLVTGPIAAVGVGLVALASKTAETANRIAKGAREAGLSAQSYQELQFALGQVADVSEENVDRAFQKLTTTLGKGENAGKLAKEAFAKLGISESELASGSVTTEDAFGRLIAAMKNAKSPAEAAAIAGALLGDRVGPKLAGALRESGGDIDALREKAQKMGIVLGDDALKAAEEFTDQWDVMKRQFVAVGQQIGSKLMPVIANKLIPFIQTQGIPALKKLADIVISLIDWFGSLSPTMKKTVAVVTGLAVAAGPVLMVLGSMATGLGVVVSAIAPFAGALAALGTGPIAILVAAIVGLTAAWLLWGDDIKRIVGQVVGWLTSNFGPPVKAIFNAVKGVVVALKDVFVAAFELQLAIAQKVGEGIVNALKAVLSFFGVEWEPTVELLGKGFEIAKRVAVGAVKLMVAGIKGQFEFLGRLFNGVKSGTESVTGFFRKMKDAVVGHSEVPDMIDGVGTHIGRLPDVMVTPVLEATSSVVSNFRQMATDTGESLFALSRRFNAQREVLDQYGLVSVATVTEKLAALDEQQKLLVEAGIPAEQAALALRDAYTQLGNAAERSGIQHAGLTAGIQANAEQIGFSMNTAVGPISDLSAHAGILSDVLGVEIPEAAESGIGATFKGMFGKDGSIVKSLKGGWDDIKGLTTGGLSNVIESFKGGMGATNTIASTGMGAIAGTAAKFMGPAGSIAGSIAGLFGPGTTGQKIGGLVKAGVRVAAGVMTGGMSEMALAAFSGVKKIAGFFKSKFGGPSAEELGGREIVKNFEQNVGKMLTDSQRMEAGNEAWKRTAIFVRDAYKQLGLTSRDSEKDVKSLWESSRSGAESSKAAVEAILGKLQGGFRVPVSFDVGRLDLPRVPSMKIPVQKMAKGGFGRVNEPTVFMAGEAGPEDFAFSGANKSFGTVGGGESDGKPIVVQVMLDGKKVAESTIQHMPRALARSGMRI